MTFRPDSPYVNEVRASPNHGERKDGCAPDMLLLHYTGMPSADQALAWLCDPRAQVSCHYFVFEDGRIVQLVPEARRAWHAGVSCWRGDSEVNSRSIGIEVANPGHDGGYPDFACAQMDAVELLCRNIVQRRSIVPQRVLAHSDVAPGRKMDPGERFDWRRLARAGVGLWVGPGEVCDSADAVGPDAGDEEIGNLQRDLARFGYCLEATGRYDQATRSAVAAFQRHYRPGSVSGIMDAQSRNLLLRMLTLIIY